MTKEKKIICPLLNDVCIEDASIKNNELVACRFWVHVIGKDPQTGKDIDNADCAFAWNPILMIENSRINRETGSAVESFRNEMVKANENTAKILLTTAEKSANNLIEVKDENNNNSN